MSSESKMISFERQLHRTKLLVTLTNEAKNKLILNEKYLNHLRDLLEEGIKTSVELKMCHEDRANDAVVALQKLAKTVEEVDRNSQAVEQLQERVASLGLSLGFPNTSALGIETPSLATTSTQSLPTLSNATPDVGDEPKRVQSETPESTLSVAGGAIRRPKKLYPKTLTRNTLIKPCGLPANNEELFNAFRNDQPPERLVELQRRLATISEDDDDDEIARGRHTPFM